MTIPSLAGRGVRRPVARRPCLTTLAGALLVLLLAACGGEEERVEHPGPEHVHGLGVNPADGALHIATHYGVFRSEEGSTSAERVGDGLQDTMGFTVVGPDHFLASGHPGPGEDGPPNLGLIESTDGGETWTEVSLGGEADFHSLVWEHERIYGYDATAVRLMLSEDGGQTWEVREAPAPVIDLAVDPDDPDRIVASTEIGLLISDDRGGGWGATGPDGLIGLLAWPGEEHLFLVDADGAVHISPDGGERWEEIGEIGGQPAALVAESARELYAALVEGRIIRSTDAGESWTVRSVP